MVGGQIYDLRRKDLRRIFNNHFGSNGRFYGAFWQNLSPAIRAAGLRIDGDGVIELDFRACHFRILCGLLGIDRPFGDPTYDPFQVAGLNRTRIKMAFNILLNTTSKKGALGALAGALREEENVRYPDSRHFKEAAIYLRAVENLFPFLERFWGKVFGLRLLNVDAAVCAKIISSLNRLGVPCLSVHDSFIVPSRHKDLLKNIMDESFQKVMRRLREVGEGGIALGVL